MKVYRGTHSVIGVGPYPRNGIAYFSDSKRSASQYGNVHKFSIDLGNNADLTYDSSPAFLLLKKFPNYEKIKNDILLGVIWKNKALERSIINTLLKTYDSITLFDLHTEEYENDDDFTTTYIVKDAGKQAIRESKQIRYPLTDISEWYGNCNYKDYGSMKWMTPAKYLSKVKPLIIDEISRENIDELKRHILSGGTLDPLVIYSNGKEDNGKEDGRHRAYASQELGIDKVPVIIYRLNEDRNLILPYNPRNINPALMTYQEYYKLVNEKEKMHPDSSYQTTLERLNSYSKIDKFPILLKRIKVKGMYFTVQMNLEKNRYTKSNTDGEYKRHYTEKEIEQKGLRKHEYEIAVFNDEEQCVGRVQDEWGCVLIIVADEYQGFGFGTLLGKLARHFEPAKPSGGFTPSGRENFERVYREIVRAALQSGLYNRMVRSKEITAERVYEILKSANLERKPRKNEQNLAINDPNDWLVLTEYGGFTLYDKKLKDVYINDPYGYWTERFILGTILVRINDTRKGQIGILVQFGGHTDKIKKFLIACAASYCASEGVPIAIDAEDMKYIDPSIYNIGAEDMTTGMRRTTMTIKRKLDLRMISTPDKLFRRSFDRYDEFKNAVLELALGKFRNT